MKWQDFYEVRFRNRYGASIATFGKKWFVVNLGNGQICSNEFSDRNDATKHAKGLFRKMQREVEKALLG